MGFLADKVGRQNTMVATVLLSGLTVFTLWLMETQVTFITFGNTRRGPGINAQW